MFEKEWNKLAKKIYTNAVNHGFWKEERNDGEAIALMHSELSEAFSSAATEPKDSSDIATALLTDFNLNINIPLRYIS